MHNALERLRMPLKGVYYRCISLERQLRGPAEYLSGGGALKYPFRHTRPEFGIGCLYAADDEETSVKEYMHYAHARHRLTGNPSHLKGFKLALSVSTRGHCVSILSKHDFRSLRKAYANYFHEWSTSSRVSVGQQIMQEVLKYNELALHENRPEDVICALRMPSARHPGGVCLAIIIDSTTKWAGLEIAEVGAAQF